MDQAVLDLIFQQVNSALEEYKKKIKELEDEVGVLKSSVTESSSPFSEGFQYKTKLSAFDLDSSYIGIGESLQAGTGIAISKPSNTPYLQISLSDVEEVTQTFQVASGDDDAEELLNGTGFSSTGLFLRTDQQGLESNSYATGVRFTNVTVPQGATITAAYVTVVEASGSDDMEVVIHGHASDNSPSFVTTPDVISRDRTLVSVTWEGGDDLVTPANSPDIAPVIQEIVDRAGWVSGNALTVFLIGNLLSTNSANGRWKSYEASPSEAIELTITYAQGTGSHTHDASELTYTPSTPADWRASVDPGDIDNALDQLADRIVQDTTLYAVTRPPAAPEHGFIRVFGWDQEDGGGALYTINGAGEIRRIGGVTVEWDGDVEWGEEEDIRPVSDFDSSPGVLDKVARADHEHLWEQLPLLIQAEAIPKRPGMGFVRLYSYVEDGVAGLYFIKSDGTIVDLSAVGGGSYTDEDAQDAVGTILADSSTIDFTYTDATPSITASVIQAALDHGSIGGLGDDDHPQYALDTDLTTHEGAADPHTGYRLESADHTHASSGLQAGLVSHDVLSDVSANDHHNQAHTSSDHTLATTAEIADVAAVESAGTDTKVPAGDHVHAHGSGYLEDAHHNKSHVHSGDGSGTVDHGSLSGLGDDDHPHYALTTELDAHLNDVADAHDASSISILDTAGDFDATDVEGALAEIQVDIEALQLVDHAEDHNHNGSDGSGKLTSPIVDTYIDLEEQSSLPSQPSDGLRLYSYPTGYGPRLFYKIPSGETIGPISPTNFDFGEEDIQPLGDEAEDGEGDLVARSTHVHPHPVEDHIVGGHLPLAYPIRYVFVPDAAPGSVVTASSDANDSQGPILLSGPNPEIATRLYVKAKTAPGASGLPITISYADTDDEDTASVWTTIVTYTLSSQKSAYTEQFTNAFIPRYRALRLIVGTIVGSPADVNIILFTRGQLVRWQ